MKGKPRVLMITQEVNPRSPTLGFVWGWIVELAKKFDRLYVATSKVENVMEKPANVEFYEWKTRGDGGGQWRKPALRYEGAIYSLKRLASYAKIAIKLSSLIIDLKAKGMIDAVFAHMNPEYVLAVAPVCKPLRIPIITWYLHKHVSLRLKLAHALSEKVLTAHEHGCRIRSSKVIVTGHGIPIPKAPQLVHDKQNVIISVGRVSKIKRYEDAIRALSRVRRARKDVRLKIVGPIYDFEYQRALLKIAREEGVDDALTFTGPVPHVEMGKIYDEAALLVSCCPALDKVVLEAMAHGVPVVVADPMFDELLKNHTAYCRYRSGNPTDLASKILTLLENEGLRAEVGRDLRRAVIEKHSLERLISKIFDVIWEAVRKY